MPHSSGGGSHGGGGHGGSHGGSGGGTSHRISHSYFNGARRFVYYKDGTPNYVYADHDITKNKKSAWNLLLGFPFYLVCAIMIVTGIQPGKPLKTDYDTTIVVMDNAHVLDNQDELYDVLERFREETGITPAVFTVYNEEWKPGRLLDYAYDIYVNTFTDEKHWLLVYSQPRLPDSDYVDWNWEGMQGNYTDPILSERFTYIFNKKLQDCLEKSDEYTVSESFTEAFETLMAAKPVRRHPEIAIMGILIFAGVFFGMLNTFGITPKSKLYATAKEVTTDTHEEACSFCGSRYVVGTVTVCPYCAAPLNNPSEEY